MSIRIFYHIYCNDRSFTILNDQITRIIFSGLYHKVDAIHCYLCGDKDEIERSSTTLRHYGKKFIIEDIGINDTTYERFTLLRIRHIISPGDKILYIHTKGVSKSIKSNSYSVYQWRLIMEYNLMCKHDKCIELLDTYDTIGLNYQKMPSPHYSGNFWWCTADYFLRLPHNIPPAYLAPEMYLLSLNANHYSIIEVDILGQSPNSYNEYIPMRDYIDNPDTVVINEFIYSPLLNENNQNTRVRFNSMLINTPTEVNKGNKSPIINTQQPSVGVAPKHYPSFMTIKNLIYNIILMLTSLFKLPTIA
jgi:hypothetical protein